MMARKIEPHIPIRGHENQTNGCFPRADFPLDAAADVFICLAGKRLTNIGLVRDDVTMPYRASVKDCLSIEGPLHER